MKRQLAFRIAVLGIALLAAACSRVEPYLYNEGQFNRDAPNFGRAKKDIESVGICYNKGGTNPGALVAMARKECAKFGKVARYQSQDMLTCPLNAPAYIIFDCLKP